MLGVLAEKAKSTPDAYPLSLNALVAGCNQKSNRYPLMELEPEAVQDSIENTVTSANNRVLRISSLRPATTIFYGYNNDIVKPTLGKH